MIKKILSIYFFRGLIAASVYCITVIIFLTQGNYQSIWLLFMGNALYMLSIGALVYYDNKRKHFNQSAVKSSISGHILSITGATISIIITLLLYLIFYLAGDAEMLHKAPVGLNAGTTHGMLLVLLSITAIGNTVAGFFAALLTSFDASEKKHHP